MTSGRTSSYTLKYYDDVDEFRLRCKLCVNKVTYLSKKGGTANYARHLHAQHRDEYEFEIRNQRMNPGANRKRKIGKDVEVDAGKDECSTPKRNLVMMVDGDVSLVNEEETDGQTEESEYMYSQDVEVVDRAAEIEKLKVQKLTLEVYKLKLEALKMETELGLPRSELTEDI